MRSCFPREYPLCMDRKGRRGGSRLVRALAIVVAAVIVLCGIAWAALAALFPPARVREMVRAQIASRLQRDVRFDDASLGLFPPVRLTVRGPALAEPGGFDHGAAFRARAVGLDLDVLALLRREVVVRRLVLDQPVVHLVLGADGSTNFDGLAGPGPGAGKPSQPMDFAVRAFDVRGGQLLVDDLAAKRRIALGLETHTALSGSRRGTRFATSGRTELRDLAFGPLIAARRRDLNQGLASLTWTIDHRGTFATDLDRLALERLTLRVGHAELGLTGVVDHPGPKALVDLRATGSGVDFGEVLRFLSAANLPALEGVKGSGRMAYDLRVRGALAPGTIPEIRGTLSVRAAAFRYPGAAAGVDDLGFTARFAPDSVGIGNLAARVAGQPVRAQLEVRRFSDPDVRFAVQGDVDLAAVSPLVAPRGTRIAGRASLDVRGSGPARDPGALALDGHARLSGVSVESPQLPQRIEKLEGTFAFSPARATVREFSAVAGKSSVSAHGSVTRPLALLGEPGKVAPARVDFALSSPYLDLGEITPTTAGGAILLPNATGGGTVAIDRLIDGRLDVRSVKAQVALAPGALSVPSYSLAGYGGDVSGSARFDLADPARPAYAVKAKVSRVNANDLLSAWTPARDWLAGSLSTDLDLSGAGDRPQDVARTLTAQGVAAIANGQLGPGPALTAIADLVHVPSFKQVKIRDGSMPFSVEQGRVDFREVKLDGPTGEWRLVGSVGFDGTLDYAVSITVPDAAVAALGATAAVAAGGLRDDQGRLLLDLKVTGPARAPRVALDRQAMMDRLKGRASQALAEQRRKLETEARERLAAGQQAAADSARADLERRKQALADSLRQRAGDALRGFFGSGRDTTPR